jgi:hypothetical protein
MKVNEVLNEAVGAGSPIDAIKKAIDAVMSVRHSRMESLLEAEGDTIAFEVEFEFPEHLVKGTEVKKAGAPAVKKVSVQKGDMWRDGVFGALYEIELKVALTPEESKSLTAEIKKLYKVK